MQIGHEENAVGRLMGNILQAVQNIHHMSSEPGELMAMISNR